MVIILFAIGILGWVVLVAAGAVALLLVLRVVANWISSNPFAWLPYHLRHVTEPMVRPFRSQFGNRVMRYDLIPIVVGVMILMTGSFITYLIWLFQRILADVYRTLTLAVVSGAFLLRILVLLAGWTFMVAILVRFLLPWIGVGYRSATMRFAFIITEPLLKPIRRIFVASMFDFSPAIAILIVQIVMDLIVSMIR